MRYLSLALLWLLNALHSVIPNWGLTIIALAVIIRVGLLPITLRGQRQQMQTIADQDRLKPLLDEIQVTFRGDPERLHKETKKVYAENNVSMLAPLAGCLWVLLQIPIFVGLYFVINESFDLRGAQFLWIQNLSQADALFSFDFRIPYFGSGLNVLPFLMAISQMLASNVSPAPNSDPAAQSTQTKFLAGMAITFFVLLYNFPSGLMLYWLMSNLGQIVQQIWWNSRNKTTA